MNKRRKCGFTMIELLVVLAIIGVIVTISIPTIASMTSPKHALRKEGRKLMNFMTEARSVAMNRKIRIDVFVDSEQNEVRAVEASVYRALLTSELDEEDRVLAMSNRFERVVAFGEDLALEAFSVGQIVAPTAEDETFEKVDVQRLEDRPEGEVRALWFTHFGGSDGGGISLYQENLRLDIAADILTGKPKIVDRKANE